MTVPNAVETGPSATPLESDIAAMFGDQASSGGESPEPEPTSAAGTTPAEPATGTESEPATTEAGDVATAAASDGTTPDTPPDPAAAETDPFADTTPATFTVNGKPVTNEDIRVFKEGGAVIRPDALPNVLNRLSERESLFERNRAQSVEYQTLAKATEWTDSAGKIISGPEAAIEMRIGNASLFAENKLLVDAITAEDLQPYLTTKTVVDAEGKTREVVIFRPEMLAQLQRENTLQQREVAAQIRDHFKTALAQAARPTESAIDFSVEAPRLIALVASESKLDASLLTPADRQLLAEHLPDHVKNGHASVKWQNLAKTMMQDRAAQKAAQRTVVDATTKATKDGLNRMAAAARGVKPAAKPAVAPKPAAKPTPQAERMADEGVLFDAMLSSGANAMRAAR